MTRLRSIVIAVVLGITTNLGVVWALAAWMPLDMYPRQVVRYFVAGGRPWSTADRSVRGIHNVWWDELDADSYSPPPRAGQPVEARVWPATPEEWVSFARTWHGRGPAVPVPTANLPAWGTFDGDTRAAPTADAGQDLAFGWPLPALWYQVIGTIAANQATASSIHGGILLTPRATLEIRGYDFRALPLRPIRTGLLLNSLLYGVLWWSILIGPPALRRVIRARAGRCRACGYHLRGLPEGSPCPECGRDHRAG